MKLKFHERLMSLTRYVLTTHTHCTLTTGDMFLGIFVRFFTDSGLDLPLVVKSLVDVDFATIATDSLTQCLQPLVTVSSLTAARCPLTSPPISIFSRLLSLPYLHLAILSL